MAPESNDWKDVLNNEVDRLKRTRDEIELKLHLGAADVKDAWANLEHSWEQLETKVRHAGEIAQDAGDDVERATRQLVDELKHGYERIKQAL